jgi:hypothetical protein
MSNEENNMSNEENNMSNDGVAKAEEIVAQQEVGGYPAPQITPLTDDQIRKTIDYVRDGIKMTTKTHQPFDEQVVRDLIKKHRELNNMPPSDEVHFRKSPRAVLDEFPDTSVDNALIGQNDVSWRQFFMFFRDELHYRSETDRTMPYNELVNLVGWLWLCDEHAIVVEKPVELHVIETDEKIGDTGLNQYVAHNENGPAILYSDGFGIFAIEGEYIGSTVNKLRG